MWLTKFLLGILAAYLGIVALVYAMQTRLLFPVRLASGVEPLLPNTAIELTVTTPDNVHLEGVRVPPAQGAGEGAPIILGFGGNAWNAETAATYLHGLFPGNEVIVFHYRGYGPSTGRPSAANLLSDSLLVHDYLQEVLGSGEFVGIGFSIGSGVAAHLASQRPLAGLIMVSPFDSLKALAAHHYPWLPVSLLLRHNMDPEIELQDVDVPTAVIAAELDSVVPPRRTESLRQAIVNLVLDHTIAGANHNDLYDRPEFRSAMIEALGRIRSKGDD